MATIDATQLPTIENFVRMQDPNDRIAAFIVDSLKQRNPILEDMTWMQGNMPTGHMTLPSLGILTVCGECTTNECLLTTVRLCRSWTLAG